MKSVSKKALSEETQKLNRYLRNEAHRPSGRSDEMPSRHNGVPIATTVLMFNCNRCSFELLAGDLSTLPESEVRRRACLAHPLCSRHLSTRPAKRPALPSLPGWPGATAGSRTLPCDRHHAGMCVWHGRRST